MPIIPFYTSFEVQSTVPLLYFYASTLLSYYEVSSNKLETCGKPTSKFEVFFMSYTEREVVTLIWTLIRYMFAELRLASNLSSLVAVQHPCHNMTTNTSNNSNKSVPFFVLHLSDDKVKALFTVPSDMAEKLVNHPILCRGASFDLKIDVVSQSREKTTTVDTNTGTSFLSTEFSSPDPEGTARAIADRIFIRAEYPSPAISHLFGWEVRWLSTSMPYAFALRYHTSISTRLDK